MNTGFPRADARNDFDKARWRERMATARKRLNRRDNRLRSFDEVRPRPGVQLKHRGEQAIDVHRIVGSVDRTREFDAEFRPTSSRTRHRWEEIAEALRKGRALPPISVYKVDDDYFVRDGHHRVSVARALGRPKIDADITEVVSGG